jgi:hypothetical protein
MGKGEFAGSPRRDLRKEAAGMIDPKFGEQLELFPETQPTQPERKRPESEFLSKQDEKDVLSFIEVVQVFKLGVERLDGEDLEEAKAHLRYLSRCTLGATVEMVENIVMPFYNVPHADSEFLLEHLLESLNPPLYQRYMEEKKAKSEQLMGGDMP